MTRRFIEAILVSLLLIASSCSAPRQETAPRQDTGVQRVKGQVIVKADSKNQEILELARTYGKAKVGDPCTGAVFSSGYSDLDAGTSVVIKDGSGTTVASGQLAPGQFTVDSCSFRIDMNNVPRVDFYEFRVGNRAGPTFSRADLEALAFYVELTIGG